MRKSKPTKSNNLNKILRQISRDEELERNDGKWVAMNRTYKDKKKYNRNDKKEELRKGLSSIFFLIESESFYCSWLSVQPLEV
jgi:hypothetical protein